MPRARCWSQIPVLEEPGVYNPKLLFRILAGKKSYLALAGMVMKPRIPELGRQRHVALLEFEASQTHRVSSGSARAT